MSLTYGDLKEQLIDMGFEDSNVLETENYDRVFRNAINRATSVIYNTVERQLEWFILKDDDIDELEVPLKVKVTTSDSANMNMATICEPLLPLLAAHYIWLDDDIQKATYYYNEYDSLKQEIVSTANLRRKATIVTMSELQEEAEEE